MIKKIITLFKHCFVAVFLCTTLAGFAQNDKPNILFILADDLGINDLGCYGNEFYETPHIDKLCSEGIKFNHHYSAGAVCSPTRTSIITGKYPARTHSTEVYPWGINNKYLNEPLMCTEDLPLDKNQPFLAGELKKLGYKTAIYGKWHIEGVNPEEAGFDEWLVNHNGTKEDQDANDDEFHINKIHNLTENFIETCVNNNEPFFAFVSHHSVHVPQSSSTKNREYFEQKGALPIWKDRPSLQTPVYAGMLKDLDSGVGNLLSKVNELGIKENTIVIFTSDNGGLSERNFPFRGGKSSQFEGGIRVPCIIRWPVKLNAGIEKNRVVVSTDYFPTLIDLAGGKLEENVAPDGENFAPSLFSDNQQERQSAIFHFPHYRGTDGQSWLRPWSVIRKGNYTYIHHWEGELTPQKASGIYKKNELYDVIADKNQSNNLLDIKPDLADSLKKELLNWLTENNAQIPSVNKGKRYPEEIENKTKVGAIRWDWTGGGNVNEAIEKTLSPKQFHTAKSSNGEVSRIPWFGQIISENKIEASCNTQSCVDQEILYAKENGLDYWAFLLYSEGSDLDLPFRMYQSSGYKSELKYCVITQEKNNEIERLIGHFKDQDYLTVLNGRSLLYIYGEVSISFINDIKAACASENILEPYVVPMQDKQEPGYDAISRYWYNGTSFGGSTDGAPYSVLADAAINNWNQNKKNGFRQIPLVSAGTDGNPRIVTGVPWIDDPGFYEKYFETPTAEELVNNVQDALTFVETNRAEGENCEANTILIYAWNENDEGGWIMPTLNADGTIDESRLKEIKKIIAPKQDYAVRASNADLYSLSYNGNELNGFDSSVKKYKLNLLGENFSLPQITAITSNKLAEVKVKRANDIPGTDTIKVISEDGLSENIYTVDITGTNDTGKLYYWDFKNKGDSEGWKIKWASHSFISVDNDILKINITGNYPELLSPESLDINTEIYKKIKIRLKNNTTSNDWYFTIYTSLDSRKNIKMTPTILDDGFKEYEIDLSSYPEWQGTINQIALLPARNVGTGTVEIDYILLESSPTSVRSRLDWKTKIYPNPNNGNFYFETDYKIWSGGLILSIFNIHGEIIYKENIEDRLPNQKMEINLQEIPPGIYFVRAESKFGMHQVFNKMFLKN